MAVHRITETTAHHQTQSCRLYGHYEPGGEDWREIQVDESGFLRTVIGPGDAAIGAVELKDHDSELRADISATGAPFGNGLHGLCYIDPSGRARAAAVDTSGRIVLSSVDFEIGAVELKNFDTNTRAEVSNQGSSFGPALHTMPFVDATGGAKAALVDASGRVYLVADYAVGETFPTGNGRGVLGMGVLTHYLAPLDEENGQTVPLRITQSGSLYTIPQAHTHLDECESTDGWTELNDDTDNLDTTTNHVFGQYALKFDKVDGLGNTIFAAIQKTVTSTHLGPYHHAGGFFLWSLYLPDTTDVAYTFLRVGTDNANYNEWRIDDDDLEAGWNALRSAMLKPDAVQGNGWNHAAVTYICVGVAFDAQNDTLAAMAVDHISANAGMQTSADITAQVTSAVNTANINLHRVGNRPVDVGAGTVGNGTQRVTLASDDPAVTALEIIDDWDATHGAAHASDGPQSMLDYNAVPAAVGDGQAVRSQGDAYGRTEPANHLRSIGAGLMLEAAPWGFETDGPHTLLNAVTASTTSDPWACARYASKVIYIVASSVGTGNNLVEIEISYDDGTTYEPFLLLPICEDDIFPVIVPFAATHVQVDLTRADGTYSAYAFGRGSGDQGLGGRRHQLYGPWTTV